MTLQTITTTLQENLQNGELILGDNTFDEINLTDLLDILNSRSLTISDAAIRVQVNAVELSGRAVILGAEAIDLNIVFTANGDAVDLSLNAGAAIGQIPGAPWFSIANLQLTLSVSGGQVGGTLSGVLLSNTVQEIAITLSVNVGETVMWRSELQGLSLSTITDLFLNTGSPPQDIPDFVFASLALQLSPALGEFNLTATINSDWNINTQVLGVQVDLAVNRTATQIHSTLTINGAGPLVIADELSMQDLNLDFRFESGDWVLSGRVSTTLFENTLSLSASYEQREGQRLLMLALVANDSIELINLSDIGNLGISEIALTLERPAPEQPLDWQLFAAGALQLENVFNLRGALMLSREADTVRLGFMPDIPDVALPLPPVRDSMLRLVLGEFSIVRQGIINQGQTRWAFDSAIDIAIEGWHETVYRVLPPRISGQFHADNDQVMISAERVVNAVDFNIPDINIIDLTIPLGVVRVDVNNLAIRVDRAVSLSADISLGLPSDFNNLFGVGGNGEPRLEFFNVFDPDNPEQTTVDLRLSVATAGISVTPVSSPIRAIVIEEENGIAFWRVDMGSFGEVRLQVPVFNFDSVQSMFVASGGFEVVRPLRIPLFPFKRLLEIAGLREVANVIPDGLPLQDISILDENDNFRTEELNRLLSSLGNFPDEVSDSLEIIGTQFNRLPDQLPILST